MEEAKDMLDRVLRVIQRRQPAGSPPPGDVVVLVEWILSSLEAKLAKQVEAKMKFWQGMEEMREQRTELERKLAVSNRLRSTALRDRETDLKELQKAEAKLLQAEQERDTWKEKTEAYWASIQEEMEENVRLFQACGIMSEVERAEECSADLLRKYVQRIQQDHAALREEVTNLQRHIQALQKLDTERAVECTALRERVAELTGALVILTEGEAGLFLSTRFPSSLKVAKQALKEA
jgi:hypothetical protein